MEYILIFSMLIFALSADYPAGRLQARFSLRVPRQQPEPEILGHAVAPGVAFFQV